MFEISRSRASKLYIICSYFKSLKFFRTAILEPLWSHFAKIVLKSRNHNIKLPFSTIYSLFGEDLPFKNFFFFGGGGGGRPSHLRLIFCKTVYACCCVCSNVPLIFGKKNFFVLYIRCNHLPSSIQRSGF